MSSLGIFSWFSYPMSIDKRFELIKEAGFDATSLWWAEADRNFQPDMARRIGLEIDNIHLQFILMITLEMQTHTYYHMMAQRIGKK